MTDPAMLQQALDAVVVVETGEAYCSGAGVRSAAGALYILTAYHCVADGGRPYLRWRDGTTRRGRVVARAPADDLALIDVDGAGGATGAGSSPVFSTLTLQEGPLVQGAQVWGLGHPFGLLSGGRLSGLLEWSVTHGVVSAAGGYAVQTDAALNPGNSGGPLIDEAGALIGVVSRKLRADNLAFVSTTEAVRNLLLAADAAGGSKTGPTIGGSYGLGLMLDADQTTWGGGYASVSIRDRLVLDASIGVAPSDNWALHGDVNAMLRQRLGHGALTATFDLGGQLGWDSGDAADGAWFGGAVQPKVGTRVGFNSVLLGLWYHPGDPHLSLTLQVAWPGKIGVF
jgi:hypothetical protein